MNAIQRMQAVLAGRRPDRPPVSFWYHFAPDQVCGPPAVKAHVDHWQAFDLDFIKVMNDNGYPHDGPVASVADLRSVITVCGDAPEFQRQLDLLADLKRETGGQVMLITTIFNPWAVLRHLVRPPQRVHKPPNLNAAADQPSQKLKQFIAEDADAVGRALEAVARTLEDFARRCLAAGADGVFLSVRDDWLDYDQETSLYERVLRPLDVGILQSVADAPCNILHVCGRPLRFERFASYPAHVINWADRAAGPPLAEVVASLKPVPCGGVDNLETLPNGRPEDCAREVREALKAADNSPIIISPGCTYDPEAVPRENLEAICRAARSGEV